MIVIFPQEILWLWGNSLHVCGDCGEKVSDSQTCQGDSQPLHVGVGSLGWNLDF